MMQLKETTKQVPGSDSQFVGGEARLLQWSIRHGRVVKDYGHIMKSDIQSMVTTSDKKWLFISDYFGHQKQINIRQQKVVQDYGQIHEDIRSIAITADNKYLFTSNFNNGDVKQFRVSDGRMIKNYRLLMPCGIRSIITTPDSKYLFAGDNDGYLIQICIESQEIAHNYWGFIIVEFIVPKQQETANI